MKLSKTKNFGNAATTSARLRRALCAGLFAAICLPLAVSAQYGRPPESSLPQGGKPEVLKSVAIEQKLNETVALDAVFRDEAGRDVAMSEYFKKGKPVVFALVYYECPMMCNQILNSLTSALMALQFSAGEEFEVVTVSFDPREGPELAAQKKKAYLQRYGREGADAGWHFLTGSQDSIERLTKSVGFNFAWDEKSKQFAHGAAIMVATPEGKLSHYFYGVEYSPRELRLALVESAREQIGSPVDQLLLYCYHYDPISGKYGPAILNIIRLAGVLTVAGLLAFVLILRKRGRRGGGGDRWDEKIDLGGAA